MTHAHPRAVLASQLYVETLMACLAGKPLPAALAQAWKLGLAALAPAETPHFARLLQPDFAATPRLEIQSSGYVIDSLEAAVWCAENSANLAEVMLLAVNLGEDTDTIAQLAACLFAAGHPDATVPATWRRTLRRTTQSDRIIAAFAAKFGRA